MIYTQAEMIKRLHDTKAVSIWNHKTGPIFWYAASVPGPFYVNTELVIGPETSARLLKDITNIVAEKSAPEDRANALETLIMSAVEADETFRNVIETMVAKAKADFPEGSFSLLSGGERRDWLFSIPMAKQMGLRHVYLFKNGDYYCEEPIGNADISLHVSDLINNAASYFDNWLPILNKAGLSCAGTLCVNSRGDNGVNRLKEAGLKVVAINSIDTGFFEKSLASGLIDEATLEELRLFFRSAQEWASAYVIGRPELFNVMALDAKSFERMQIFFGKDPWNMRGNHAAFFAQMADAIKQRLTA